MAGPPRGDGLEHLEEVQKLLAPFSNCTVIHGHTHQMLTNRIGNIHFHGMLSTAWPWPYAPQGLPKLTIHMNRAYPFDEFDGCGDGSVDVFKAGRVDKHYNLWSRNPIRVSAAYLDSDGQADKRFIAKLVTPLADPAIGEAGDIDTSMLILKSFSKPN